MVRDNGKVPAALLVLVVAVLQACGSEARSAEEPTEALAVVEEGSPRTGAETAGDPAASAPDGREAAALAVRRSPARSPEAPASAEETRAELRPRSAPPAVGALEEAAETGGPIPAPAPSGQGERGVATGAAEPPAAEPPDGGWLTADDLPAPEVEIVGAPDPVEAPEPAVEPAPEGVVLQPGLEIVVVLESELTTRSHRPGDAFYAYVEDDVLAPDGMVLVPLGARVRGRVVESRKSAGPDVVPVLEVVMESLIADGRNYPLVATVVRTEARAERGESTARSAAKVGVGAAAGAIIGKLLGKDTEAAVAGAVVGAAAGTAAALSAKDGHATIPQGSAMVLRLDVPLELAAG